MYFEQNRIEIRETWDARKEKIDREQAWELIKGRNEVIIGKGKKMLTYVPDTAAREEILKAAMGRSGNLRAPSIDTGTKIIIGYTDGIYASV